MNIRLTDIIFLVVVGIALWCSTLIANAEHSHRAQTMEIVQVRCTNINGQPMVGTKVEFEDFVLTANHVTLTCADGQEKGWERFPNNDLAIQLKVPIEEVELPFTCTYQPEGRNVAFLGYPANWWGAHRAELAVGVIMSEDPQFMIANGFMLVDDLQLAWTDRVRPGYSGGAVVTGDHAFAGIAVAVQKNRVKNEPRGAFFVPTKTICAAFETLYK